MSEQTVSLTKREQKLRYAKPWEAIIYFCAPMVAIMIIQGLYNIIDKNMAQDFTQDDLLNRFSYLPGITIDTVHNFVNLTTGYTMTAYYTLFAFAALFGVGSSIVFSMQYGRRNIVQMRKAMGNMVGLQIVLSIVIAIILFFLMNVQFNAVLVQAQMNGALSSEQQNIYLQLSWEYSRIFIFCAPLLFLSFALPAFLRTEGKVYIVLIMQILSIPVNVLFSYIFAKLCHLEMSGVMMGSMMAWIFNIVFSTLVILFSKNSYCRFSWRDMIWSKEIIVHSLPSGFGAFFMNLANAVQLLITTILVVHLPGQDNVVIYIDGSPVHTIDLGIYICQLVYTTMSPFVIIFISVGIGLAQGSSAVCAYAFGARKYQRIAQITKRVAILQFAWFALVTIVIIAFADKMMLLYDFPAELIGQYRWYGVLLFSTYSFAAITYIAVSLYPAIGQPVRTLISSMLRSLLVILPLSFIGYGISIATGNNIDYFILVGLNDLICALILAPMLYNTWKKNKDHLVDHEDNFAQQEIENSAENIKDHLVVHSDEIQ